MDDTFRVISIDELAELCGYFTSATDANNGYGCNHPEQENYEMLYKDESGYTQRENTTGLKKVKQGMCYSFSCPLASKCNIMSEAQCIGACITALLECDCVYFCKNWEKSRGCRIEHFVSTEHKI